MGTCYADYNKSVQVCNGTELGVALTCDLRWNCPAVHAVHVSVWIQVGFEEGQLAEEAASS